MQLKGRIKVLRRLLKKIVFWFLVASESVVRKQ